MNDQSDQSGREYDQEMENLRIELKEAHIYYRESLSMVFRVAVTTMLVFAGEMTFYVTCSGHSELSYLTMQIPAFGILTSCASFVGQLIALEMHWMSRKYYLRPLKESLGLPPGPIGWKRAWKNTIEYITVILLLAANVVYFLVWISIQF